MAGSKPSIITFKVDPYLSEFLEHLPNRSEFIRAAVLAAMENTCPLCMGAGVLTVSQKRHWTSLMARHALVICETCHEPHIVCHHEHAVCPDGTRAA